MKPSWPPTVVARHPGTITWPSAGDATAVRRRTRRIAATAIALAGVINLASAATIPIASRLGALRRFAPIAIPEAATVLVALAGVGLLFLARGVRRGQRHAWSLALALLLVSVAGHVIKGLDIEEAVLTLMAAIFLASHPADFAAPANPSSARRARSRVSPDSRSRSRPESSVWKRAVHVRHRAHVRRGDVALVR